MSGLDAARLTEFVERAWAERIVPALHEYIAIPAQSPQFDAGWERHGHLRRAVQLVAEWCTREVAPLPGASVTVHEIEGRTPVVLIDVPGTAAGRVLLYGHLDKQPPMEPWAEGLGPWKPVLRGDKLYGRGGADDGYAAFASLTALRALAEQGLPRAHCTVLIEACEESGSVDLPAHLQALADALGRPDLVVCLDSGCGNYEQLWCTTSLRGLVCGTLRVETMSEGVHSGDAGGVAPSAFRIASRLIGRIEDGVSGRVTLPELNVAIPEARRREAGLAAAELDGDVHGKYPLLDGVRAEHDDAVELVLNRTWRPALAVTGVGGLPPIENAGNVLHPRLDLQLSIRLPPTADARAAGAAIAATLERDVPSGARARFRAEAPCAGWNAPPTAPWLAEALQQASQEFFGRPACAMGEGGSIPFMAMLGERFPAAQFMITGVLGPKSNAHGPNEFLHLPTARRLTCCVAAVIAAQARSVRT